MTAESSPRELASPPTSVEAGPRTSVVFLYGLAFLSGMAALVYQVAWARMLSLTFGGTTVAAATVVASFMGGMGLGAWLYHRFHRHLPRPLLVFIALEAGIALSTALLSATFYSLPELFAELSGSIGSGWLLALVRLVSVFLLLAIPATLMGATFPALCTVMIHSVKAVDRHLGLIYGINTLGAAGGAILSGFVLIERFGLRHSVTIANGANLLVALGALLLVRGALGRRFTDAVESGDTSIPTFLPRRVMGFVLLASGFSTLSYEMYWLRAFLYVMGNSTYALSITIVVFLVGLGFGSLQLHRVLARGAAERSLVLIQASIGLVSLLGMAGIALLLWSDPLRESLSIYSNEVRLRPWGTRLVIQAGVALVTLLPATILMGLTFPLATRLYLGDVKDLRGRVGMACFLSSLGSILGSGFGAILLLPYLGSIGGTKFSTLLNLAVAVLLALYCRQHLKSMMRPLLLVGIPILVGVVLLPNAPRFRGLESEPCTELIHQQEGSLGTVQVLQDPTEPRRKMITIDGSVIGVSDGFFGQGLWTKQTILVHVPMILDTRIRNVLNIGLGSGSTLDTLTHYPELEKIDCVEISPAVVRGVDFFEEKRALDDPRVRLFVDDAVNYLLRSDEKYDLIVSDGKQDPFHSGNAILLCYEFYEYALRSLSDDGLFIQWISIGTLSSDVAINMRTLCEVFPHVGLFFAPPTSFLFIASPNPLAGRPGMTDAQFAQPHVQSEANACGLYDVASVRSLWTADRTKMRRALGEGPISRWDHLYLDFAPFKATREEWRDAPAQNIERLCAMQRAQGSPFADFLVPRGTPERQASNLLRRAFLQFHAQDVPGALELVNRALEANPNDRLAQGFRHFFQSKMPRPR